MKKKILLGLFAIFITPSFALAATNEELQAQINALIAQLQAQQGGASYSSQSCNFSMSAPVKLGDYSNDVYNLQRALNSDPATQVASYGAGSPGNETNFFGMATRNAVMRFQAKYANEILYPQGFFEPTGFVGYATIAKVNSLCKVTVNTNTNSTTNTNQSQTTTGNTDSNLSGGAGYLNITKYNSDIESTITTGRSENVVAFKARAEGSDLKITNIRIELDKYNSSGSNYPNRYFQSFDIYADDNKVGSIDVGDLSRDSSGHYSKSVSLNSAKIKMGSSNQVIFKIKARGADYIDSDNKSGSWRITLSNIRYIDATGANLFLDNEITSNTFAVERLSDSGDVKIKISSGSSNPEERTVFVSDTSSGDKVTLNEFKIKSEGTKITFDTLSVRYSVNGVTNLLSDKITEMQLVRDDRVLATIDPYQSSYNDVSNKILTFNLDDQESISDGNYATYQIVARMKKIGTSSFGIGDSMSVSVESASSLKVVNAEDNSGDSISTSRFSGSSYGKTQVFRSTGLSIVKTYSSANAISSSNSSARGYGNFAVEVKVTASGNEIYVPLSSELLVADKTNANVSGVLYQIENGAGDRLTLSNMNNNPSAVVTRISGGSTDDGYVRVSDGESATIRLQVSYDPKNSGFAKLQLLGLNYKTSKSDSSVSYISATPLSDFETQAVDIRP